MTPKENSDWGTRTQRSVEKRSDAVFQLTLDYILVKKWSSINEAGRNGFNKDAVCACCNGKRKSHKGFLWMKKLPLS